MGGRGILFGYPSGHSHFEEVVMNGRRSGGLLGAVRGYRPGSSDGSVDLLQLYDPGINEVVELRSRKASSDPSCVKTVVAAHG